MDSNDLFITYRDVGVDRLDEIQASWERLRAFHVALSADFADDIRRRLFADRCEELRRKAQEGGVRVDVAMLESTGQCVGHCISSRSSTAGEIESLGVDEAFRGRGIGSAFMRRALAWFDDHQVTKRKVSLIVENNAALKFYRRFGFVPRSITMQQRT